MPHHGSANQDAEFLTALGARVAIASVGADNDYGHAVVIRDGGLRVATERGDG